MQSVFFKVHLADASSKLCKIFEPVNNFTQKGLYGNVESIPDIVQSFLIKIIPIENWIEDNEWRWLWW